MGLLKCWVVVSKAWFDAMTMHNITMSFKVTGVCPYSRKAFNLTEEEDISAFKPEQLEKETGLAYIPLYSPAVANRSASRQVQFK